MNPFLFKSRFAPILINYFFSFLFCSQNTDRRTGLAGKKRQRRLGNPSEPTVCKDRGGGMEKEGSGRLRGAGLKGRQKAGLTSSRQREAIPDPWRDPCGSAEPSPGTGSVQEKLLK